MCNRQIYIHMYPAQFQAWLYCPSWVSILPVEIFTFSIWQVEWAKSIIFIFAFLNIHVSTNDWNIVFGSVLS